MDVADYRRRSDPVGHTAFAVISGPEDCTRIHAAPGRHVARAPAYAASDQRIFECPCPACGAFTEILWEHIEWEAAAPAAAAFRCPHCKELVGEQHKASMVEAGHWRATAPAVQGHAGFQDQRASLSARECQLGQARRGVLATKDDPEGRQVFTNTILAQGWRAPGAELDEAALCFSAEPFDLDNIRKKFVAHRRC